MDTDDLSPRAYDVIVRAARVSDTLKANLGAQSRNYKNEDAWLRGIGKFLQKIVEEPEEYVDYWDLEEEEGVTATMICKIATELFRHVEVMLIKSKVCHKKSV